MVKFGLLTISVVVFLCLNLFCTFKPTETTTLGFDKKNIEAFVSIKDSVDYSNSIWQGFNVIEDSTFTFGIDKDGRYLYKCNLSQNHPYFTNKKLPDTLINSAKFGPISSFHLSSDTIITIFQKERILIINLLLRKVLYSKDISLSDSSKIAYVDYNMPIYYNETLKSIFVQIVFAEGVSNKKYGFDTEFHAKINISTNTMDVIPVKYPQSYGNGELGYNSFMKTAIFENKITYSSTNEKWIEVYSLTNNTSKLFEAQSSYHVDIKYKNESDFQDKDKNLKNLKLNFNYEDIFYDQKRKLIYRVFAIQMKEKNDDGFFNTVNDKKKGIVLLNNKFEMLGEIIIPEAGIYQFGSGYEGFYYRSKAKTRNDSVFQKYTVLVPKI